MSGAIENLFHENRRFPPSDAFRAGANAGPDIYERAAADRLGFWASEAEQLVWRQPWTQILDDSEAPFYRWFTGGVLNVTESCLSKGFIGKPQLHG